MCSQVAHLVQQFAHRPRALATATQRHDAVGAELVAAVDDGHEGRRPRRQAVGLEPELTLGDVARAGHARHFEDRIELLRSRPYVDVWEAALELGGLRPDHAAHHGDRELAAALAALAQHAETAIGAVLGVLSHGAGVDDHEVRIRVVVEFAVAEALEPGGEFERVRFVHLAAERPDVEGRHGAPPLNDAWRRGRDSNPRPRTNGVSA